MFLHLTLGYTGTRKKPREHGRRMDMKQKITSRPGLFGSINHYDQKGHKIGSSRQGIFGSTIHYDAKGHKVGSSWNSPTRSDHYDAQGHRAGKSYHGSFSSTHYDTGGHRVGKTTKGGFGRKDSWFED